MGDSCDTIILMTATGHALIGAVIAAKISNPALAIPIALASHLAADLFPHWDLGTNAKGKSRLRLRTEATLDVIVGFILSYLLIYYIFPTTNISYAFFMIIVSQLPDWLTMPYYFFNIRIQPFVWAYKFQKHFDNRLDKPWGIINQVSAILILVLLAKFI